MELKRAKVKELMDTYCRGNYNRFARELGLDPSHLYRFLNEGIGGGKKVIGAVNRFCKLKKLDFFEYIDI